MPLFAMPLVGGLERQVLDSVDYRAFVVWKGNGPEWDLVAGSIGGDALLLGEVRWSEQPIAEAALEEAARILLAKGAPQERWAHGKGLVHAVFVSRLARTRHRPSTGRLTRVVTAEEILAALR